MKNEKLDLIYRDEALEVLCDCCSIEGHCSADGCAEYQKISKLTTVDAVELPKGKPGDYLLWDNGAGYRRPYRIDAIMICDDCVRYCISICNPVVNHHGIVRIMSREEAERWVEDGKADRCQYADGASK